ncbi:MAG: PPOX class F420-dependent oxidoreductase [Dehalococcoidia bacterium]
MTTASGMTPEQIEAFLGERRNIMVAALRRDGRPQVTPNWFYWDGARFYVSTTKARQKYKNFRRDPRVQLVLDDVTGFRTLLIDGTVELRDDIDAALPYFRQISARFRDQPEDPATLRERLVRENRVLLVITPEKPPEQWSGWTR